MKDEKNRKAMEAMDEKKPAGAAGLEELCDDDLDSVAGGMSFTANQNLTLPKNSN